MNSSSIISNLSKSKDNKNENKTIVFNKRYTVNEEIAHGGLSIVYHVLDKYDTYFNNDSNTVIKIPNDDMLNKSDIAAFVYSEYVFLKNLKHSNIVNVLDFGIDKKTKIPYLILEHLKGRLLQDETISLMSKDYKNKLFITLYDTINYIHSKDIIHADINPSNVMVSDDEFTIFDFGISQNINNKKNFSLEYNNNKAYNPRYCAPEVLEGKTPDIKSDIFSFACVMYEIYTQKQFIKESSLELLNNQVDLDFKDIPFVLRKWFKNALSTNPKNRDSNNYFIKFLK